MNLQKATLRLLIGVIGWHFSVADISDIATCHGCWCIPDSGESCPWNWPQVEFPEFWLNNLRSMELENPMKLPCNPYKNSSCQTAPALEEGGACVAEIIPPSNATHECPTGYTYRLKTVASQEEAEKNLQIVTHLGACGLCSTFHDLIVYMTTPNLVEIGIKCGLRALIDFDDGLDCYMESGFSEGCARIWIHDSQYTNLNCPMCQEHVLQGLPNNLDTPTCDLAECIQCDEDEAGPIFKKFGGRTRRSSGLLSAIVRNCSEFQDLVQRDPCDTTPLILPPTPAPSALIVFEESVRSNDSSSAAVGTLLIYWLALSGLIIALPI